MTKRMRSLGVERRLARSFYIRAHKQAIKAERKDKREERKGEWR